MVKQGEATRKRQPGKIRVMRERKRIGGMRVMKSNDVSYHICRISIPFVDEGVRKGKEKKKEGKERVSE